ncbi:hypothetical protein ACEWY4_001305 [Coilia grayii]|uniref:THAP-type domain-containing protein n=1 Tax=Coilia grayii TaxID=363190 RepID=A0ABD1KSM0_9TELE
MPRTCCVVVCTVRSHDRSDKKIDNGISFYSFPAWKQRQGSYVAEVTKRRRMAWISAVRRVDITFGKSANCLRVCSRHFLSGKPAYEMDESNTDCAATLHLGHSEVRVTSDRYARRLKRARTAVPEEGDAEVAGGEQHGDDTEVTGGEECGDHAPVTGGEERGDQTEATGGEECGDQTEATGGEVCGDHAPVTGGEECEDQTEATGGEEDGDQTEATDCELCTKKGSEMNRLLQENRELRAELSRSKMDEDFFRGKTEKVKYYTGLPCFAILFSMISTVQPYLPAAKKLTSFQMVLLTLIRLRLDLPVTHLSHIFNVSRKTPPPPPPLQRP